MNTINAQHDTQLAAIKARHASLAAKFRDPYVNAVELDANAPLLHQLGLTAVFVDPIGRFWKMERGCAVMVFDLRALVRNLAL